MGTQTVYIDNKNRRWDGQHYFKQEVAFEQDAYFKLAPHVDVKAYGATGDGSTDDTTAIQAALDAAETTGNPIFFPFGTYMISATLKVANGMRLIGSTMFQQSWIKASAAIAMIESDSVDTAASTANIAIENLYIDGNSLATDGIVLGTDSFSYLNSRYALRDMQIVGCTNGVTINGSTYGSMERLFIAGTNTAASTGLKFGQQCQGAVVKNVQVHGFAVNIYGTLTRVSFENCTSYCEATDTNTTNLVKIEDCYGYKFIDCTFENLLADPAAINEVLVQSTSASPTYYTENNSFVGCVWNGTCTTSTNLVLGQATKSATAKTVIDRCKFSQGVTTNISFANASGTIIRGTYRVAGYSGVELTVPTFTGTDAYLQLGGGVYCKVDTVSGLSGATGTRSNFIPGGALVLGITVRVTTLITGATTFDVGDGTDVDRWGAAIAVALNTTTTGTAFTVNAPAHYAADTDLVLTANGSNFTAGAVKLLMTFMVFEAPAA